MKNFFGLIVLFNLFVSFAVSAGPVIKHPKVNKLYIPDGFDANDSVEVVVNGTLPNLCYKSPHAVITHRDKTIEITVNAYYHPADDEAECIQVRVPYTLTANLGVLDKGKYDIVVNRGIDDEQSGLLKVNESTSDSVDDFVYANVKYVEQFDFNRNIVLHGYHPTTCYELEEIKFSDNGADTYVVQPILKKVSDFCPKTTVPFEYEVELPRTLNRKIFLIHVRTMDGNSVNTLYGPQVSK